MGWILGAFNVRIRRSPRNGALGRVRVRQASMSVSIQRVSEVAATVLSQAARRRPRALAGVPLLLLLAACQAPTAPPPRILPVRSEAAAAAMFSDTVDTVSTLEALEEVQLAAQAGGRIERLLVRQGDQVRPGQLLLVLDQTQIQADVARLKAQMESDRLNYQRFDFLVRKGAASALQRDDFRQKYIATRAQLIARQADLAFRDLTAPIGGVVGDVQVKQGDVIQAGAPFTRIVRNDRLLARVDVPAVYAARLRPGLPVILLDPASGRPLATAPIRSLDPAVVAGTQSLLAKAEFANPGGILRNGLRTRTRVVLDARQQLSVPFAAVTQISGQSFVFRVGSLADLEKRPGQAKLAALRQLPPGSQFALQTPVELGPLQNNRYPVLRGLEPGARVITSNLINLRHGLPITAN
jgi:RND family efflux transporter MFP subunit